MAEDRVADAQELVHAGGDGDLPRFASLDQALVQLFDDGIEPDGAEGGHVQHCADGGSATPDAAFATPAATIPIERCDADQCTELLVSHLAGFGHIGQ